MLQPRCSALRIKLEELKALQAQFNEAFNEAIRSGNLERARELRKEIETRLEELRNEIEPKEAREQKLAWQTLYKELFNLDITNEELRKIKAPRRTKEEIQEGFKRLIMVHESMTAEELYKKCEELFKAWKDIDISQITSERNPKDGSYIIWVKDNEESDEDMKNKSADDIKEQNIKTETFEERLLHELKYFKETGKHLDEINVTLCAGSRFLYGSVPSVYWRLDNGKMNVDWYSPARRNDSIRARVAVS